MLMPLVSVTAIGIIVAAVGLMRGYRTGLTMLLHGIVGAWLGFIVGALPGVMLDVLLGDGVYLALTGHLGAVVGAVAALLRSRPGKVTSSVDP